MDYFIFKEKRQQGPFTLDQLAGIGISSETLVWREGMAQWTPAWQIDELKDILAGNYKPDTTPPPVAEPAPEVSEPKADADVEAENQAEPAVEEKQAEPAAVGSKPVDRRHKRAAIWLAVVAAVFFLLLITCPGTDKHCRAVSDEVAEAITQKVGGDNSGDSFAGMFGSMLATRFVDAIVGQMVTVDDYYIFSVGKVRFAGKEKAVSFGILGHVFTFDSADLNKMMDENIPLPDTMAL